MELFPLPTSHSTLLCSTDSHYAHNSRHLCIIFHIIIHPSQFTYRQKLNKHTFPVHASSRMRREVVWGIFEQNTSYHFSVHVRSVKCEEGSVKREAVWNFSLMFPGISSKDTFQKIELLLLKISRQKQIKNQMIKRIQFQIIANYDN